MIIKSMFIILKLSTSLEYKKRNIILWYSVRKFLRIVIKIQIIILICFKMRCYNSILKFEIININNVPEFQFSIIKVH